MTMKNVLTFNIETDEVEIFLQDIDEHLQAMETGILRLERTDDPDTLNAVFRAAHTIKSVAATIGHHRMAELTHTLETLFDAMREGRLSATQAVTDELLATVDVLKALRDEVVALQPSGVDVTATLGRLHALMGSAADETAGASIQAARNLPVQRQLTPEQIAQMQACHEDEYAILEVEIVATGASVPTARLLQANVALEEVSQIIAQYPSQPDLLDDQDADHLWLILATQVDQDAVEEILSDVSELSEFRVQPYRIDGPPTAFSGDLGTDARQSEDKTVRISVERLDTLMNLVGELVADRTRLIQIENALRARHGKDETISALGEMKTHFSRMVERLQEEVMQARMLPIVHLFQKFPRLVRDLARDAGKQVDLVIEGEATELDRSIIEIIGDPLIHLLRNAVDHGIELPDERTATGKPATGTVWLTAGHEEGHIVITVKDDGQGIDPAQVRRAAVKRGLLSEEEVSQLNDDEIVSFIFQPNLSTVEHVTDVSGRGVGLDVVQTNVKRLGGSVMVESEVGRGTTFCITLPLTLAILQAMLVAIGGDVYAISLTGIIESLYLSNVTVNSVKGNPVIHWRDSVLPLLYLRQFFTHPRLAAASPNGNKQAVVVVTWGKQQIGLVVDKLIGKQEAVVKSISPIIGHVPELSGCTILGDGRVALIIDVPALINTVMQARR
jgi:two-component system chemotaxis sensor kinase CheA